MPGQFSVAINSPEILNEMKPICHLFGLRRTFSGSLCIETAAITADDLNRWAVSQPRFRALNAAVVKDIDNCSTFEIDHDRAVSGGAPPALIINPNNSNIAVLRG